MTGAVQSPQIPWTALIAAVAKALADVKANKPRPMVASTGPNVAAILTAIQAELPKLIALANAYPGVFTGLDDILEALKRSGQPWAGDIEAAIDALPGGLAQAQAWLPTVLGLLTAFSPAPAPSPIGGDPSFSRGR